MSSLPPDPWKILGVEKSADKGDIRTAYRKLVLKCHPDKVQDPTLKAQKQDEFQRVQHAYELLNDDTARAKYEQQVRLEELRRQVNSSGSSKHAANSSSARTTPTASRYTFEVRTDPRPSFKYQSQTQTSPANAKMYARGSSGSRSWEEVHTRKADIFDEERRAHRSASYEKPSRKDEERFERREREAREAEQRDREIRDREREERKKRKEDDERERRKEERKRIEKELDKRRERERRRESDDKSRRQQKTPYVEDYEHDDVLFSSSSKSEKKKSTSSASASKSKYESSPREKSTTRRERDLSPHAEASGNKGTTTRTREHLEKAASYIENVIKQSGKPTPSFLRSESYQEQSKAFEPPLAVPTPPPALAFAPPDDSRRAARRRPSHDVPPSKLAREKSYASEKRASSREPATRVVNVAPRMPPSLQKGYSSPPVLGESPPRNLARSNTEYVQQRPAVSAMPSISRAATWMPESSEPATAQRVYNDRRPSADAVYADDEAGDSRHYRPRRGRRDQLADEIQQTTSTYYHIDKNKKTRRVDAFSSISRDESPSGRVSAYDTYPHEMYSRDPQPYSGGAFQKVHQSKQFSEDDVSYNSYGNPQYTTTHPTATVRA